MRPLLAGGILLTLLATGGSAQSIPDRALFQFQNNFWVNLHHFVRAESRRQMVGPAPVLPLSALSEEQRTRWTMALGAYAELAKVSLIFDERLVKINNALARVTDAEALPPDAVEPAIVAALNAAAPIYREHLWERHRRENEQWITKFHATIEKHAAAITQALANAYQVEWPDEPLLVDLAWETGPTNAYTTAGPPETSGHTVIAPQKTSAPDAAFEIAFHEACHTVDSHLAKMVADEAIRQQVEVAPDLWHVLLFYTTGEIVKRELGKRNNPDYQPYADRFGLYTGAWEKIRAALERHWQPYLNGDVTLAAALRDVVREVGR